jgi:hypothetical protein
MGVARKIIDEFYQQFLKEGPRRKAGFFIEPEKFFEIFFEKNSDICAVSIKWKNKKMLL